MELKKLTVHNYKSLVNFELNEPNAFTVFAGPNGAGKSNIFEALEFFSYGFKVGIAELENLFGGHLQFIYRSSDVENYRITLEFDDFDVSIFQEISEPKIVIAQDSLTKTLKFMRVIFLSTSIEREDVLQNESYVHEQYFEKFLRIFINKSELNRIKYTSNERLLPDASNLESVLKRLLKDDSIKEEFLEWLDLLIPGFSNIEIHSDNIGGTDTMLIYEEGTTKPFTKNLISDGTYNILALLTAVYQTNEPQFLCIEEPENGLNPYVVETMVEFFRRQCDEKGHVIWLNTHSQTLVKALRPEELVLVDKENGETRVKQFSKDYQLYSLDLDTAWLSNVLGGRIAVVTVGFIVEGHSEDILMKSESFLNYLNTLGLQSSKELVTNVVGRNNLYRVNNDLENIKERVNDWTKKLYDKGANIIFIVLDKENDDACITELKSKVYSHPDSIIIVAVQAIEAWFLADTDAMNKFLHPDTSEIALPESFAEPYNEIDRLRKLYKGKGAGTKVSLANTIVHRCGFSLAKAAAHPACPSAAYFQRKLTEAAKTVKFL